MFGSEEEKTKASEVCKELIGSTLVRGQVMVDHEEAESFEVVSEGNYGHDCPGRTARVLIDGLEYLVTVRRGGWVKN